MNNGSKLIQISKDRKENNNIGTTSMNPCPQGHVDSGGIIISNDKSGAKHERKGLIITERRVRDRSPASKIMFR